MRDPNWTPEVYDTRALVWYQRPRSLKVEDFEPSGRTVSARCSGNATHPLWEVFEKASGQRRWVFNMLNWDLALDEKRRLCAEVGEPSGAYLLREAPIEYVVPRRAVRVSNEHIRKVLGL